MTVTKGQTLKSLLLAATIMVTPLIAAAPTPAVAQLSVGISVQLPPPALPVYAQPPIPGDGYIWIPGYWHWQDPAGYYWVPGTWVLPPSVGLLWTPPYWGWENGAYLFHDGYWGPHVGFYGGINYGFGYGGSGYDGGRWQSGHFVYNRAANNFGHVHVSGAYQAPLHVRTSAKVSYVGGTGGLRSAPSAAQTMAAHGNNVPATAEQSRHITAAAGEPRLAASQNNGRPQIAATSHAAQFQGPGVSQARPAAAPAHGAPPQPQAHGAPPAQPQAHGAPPPKGGEPPKP